MKERFSKKTVQAAISLRLDNLEKRWGFTSSTGWSQVVGKDEETNRAFGAYAALLDLAADLELGRD